ncbi:peptidoglycan recognition protein family protein [Nonomuraea sp. LPB2021202275-12-8]|uniref:peptidoglycan recognition protein family protein n=1 Tax=Nonomuraea sp. LPB2021202275-12-8 TaxID=3120159 RepID=UPI00300D64C6
MNLITRRQWGAKTPAATYTRISHTEGVKIHYTGGEVPSGIVKDHEICGELVRQIQAMHMRGAREQPYNDIGYSLAVCPHRRVFMGRGPHALPAANGAGLNTGHYAVLALVGSQGHTQPTTGMLAGIWDAIDYLRAEGDAGREIKGHRDGFSTSCPGEPLYAWIRRGAPRPGTSEDDLPELRPGDKNEHVVELRKLLKAANRTSDYFDPTDADLVALLTAWKAARKLGGGLVWTSACWKAAGL